jgi:hypothetical protein
LFAYARTRWAGALFLSSVALCGCARLRTYIERKAIGLTRVPKAIVSKCVKGAGMRRAKDEEQEAP